MITATIAIAAAYVEPLAPRSAVASRTSQKPARVSQNPCRLCADEPPAPSGDWRDFRARLVQQDQQGDSESDSSFVYETPLIERGTVILGGTQQDFGFALRQQYFHKSVMLLLQHDESFTKGIILNRPSALEIDGWRVWFGGDVAEGGLFHQGQARKRSISLSEREITLLHALSGEEVDRLSLPIIKGVQQTSLDAAKALIAAGKAKREDFWLFVGYAGWAPQQLQGEVERDSWFLAQASGGALLAELLQQGTELPPPSEQATAADGLATWGKLMRQIGRGAEVERTEGELADRMLGQWVEQRLLPKAEKDADADADADGDGGELVGTLLRSGRDSLAFMLDEQFLHKSLSLVVYETPTPLGDDVLCVTLVLNRPTANVVQFHTDGRPRRHIMFGGDARLRSGAGLEVDGNGLMWLHRRPELGGTAVGDSGVLRIGGSEAAAKIRDGDAKLDDFLLISGAMAAPRAEIRKQVSEADLEVVAPAAAPWPQIWGLAKVEADGDRSPASDGTALWWASTQSGGLGGGSDSGGGGSGGGGGATTLQSTGALPSAIGELADEALAEWLKFFAGHGGGEDL